MLETYYANGGVNFSLNANTKSLRLRASVEVFAGAGSMAMPPGDPGTAVQLIWLSSLDPEMQITIANGVISWPAKPARYAGLPDAAYRGTLLIAEL